ncbi:MAG TPA: PKD domain-containing protein [Nitrospirae bacterium]|nr:PKD domain-containing protein [Nitrospirota bacterium]HDZ01045.1 PKD domain-containing protein [Nitrospirota bacterium]
MKTGIYINGASPSITESIIKNNNRRGIYLRDSSGTTITGNTISGNVEYGIYNATSSVIVVAENNYWGDPSGPYDPSDDRDSGGWYNPDGTGDKVTDYVDYEPWLDSDECIQFGETKTGYLSAPDDSNSCTFTATANDVVRVRMGFVTGSADPEFRIFRPDGSELAECAGSETASGDSADISDCQLPDDGTYTIIASEYGGDEIGGDYNLTLERLNNTAATMSYGDTVADTLTVTADLNAHTFNAVANDRVMVRMGFATGNADPEIRLYGPDGTELTGCAGSETASGDSADISDCQLPDDGTYTIIASERNGDEIGGDYSLTLERLNNTSATMVYGDTEPGVLTVTSDSNVHAFYASADDTVLVRMQFVASGPDPQIRTYAPDGTALAGCDDSRTNSSSNDPAEILSCILTGGSGVYTIIASENNGDEIGGSYDLYVECLSGTCNPNYLPISDPNGPYPGTEGQAKCFDGSASYDPDGIIVLYEWDIDNDGVFDYSSSSPTVCHIYAQQGTYTIRLRVTDDLGATGEATTTATISDTSPTANFTGLPASGLAPLTVNFTDSSTGYDQPLSHEWDFDNDGVIDSTGQNPSYIYTTAGTYTVKLKVTDSDGSTDSLTRTDYITVDACLSPVRISPVYYDTLQAAYDAAVEGDTIQSQAVVFTEDLNINSNISVTLEGGYNCDYTTITGETTINGNMTINDGTVTIMDFNLQ